MVKLSVQVSSLVDVNSNGLQRNLSNKRRNIRRRRNSFKRYSDQSSYFKTPGSKTGDE